MKFDIKRKLTSRKFLTAVAGVITGIALIINGNTTEGTAAVITSIVAYIAAEGLIDAKAVGDVAQNVADNLKDNETIESKDDEIK